MQDTNINISVVIPTLNRDGFLLNTLKDLINQSCSSYEIVVVDQSTTIPEDVLELVQENTELIEYYQVTFRGLPEARNFGWQKAKGDIVVYIDDDVKTDEHFLQEYYTCFEENPQFGVIGGRIWEVNKPNTDEDQVGQFNPYTFTVTRGFSNTTTKEVSHVGGGNFAVKKEVFAQIGGVDERLNIGAALLEETEFCLRAKAGGYKVGYCGRASVDHLAAPSGGCRVDQVDKYMYSLGHNRGIITRRYLSSLERFTSFLFFLKLLIAFVVHYKKVSVIGEGLKGFSLGKSKGGLSPVYIDASKETFIKV